MNEITDCVILRLAVYAIYLQPLIISNPIANLPLGIDTYGQTVALLPRKIAIQALAFICNRFPGLIRGKRSETMEI